MSAFSYPEHPNASDAKTGGIKRRSVPGRLVAESVPVNILPLNIIVVTMILVLQENDVIKKSRNVQTAREIMPVGSEAARLLVLLSQYKLQSLNTELADMNPSHPSLLQMLISKL